MPRDYVYTDIDYDEMDPKNDDAEAWVQTHPDVLREVISTLNAYRELFNSLAKLGVIASAEQEHPEKVAKFVKVVTKGLDEALDAWVDANEDEEDEEEESEYCSFGPDCSYCKAEKEAASR